MLLFNSPLQAEAFSPSLGTAILYSPPRRSNKCRKQSSWLLDFVVNKVLTPDSYLSSNFSPSQFSVEHINFFERLSNI